MPRPRMATYSLDLVYYNVRARQERMLYEPALLHALTAARTNNAKLPMHVPYALLVVALRQLGQCGVEHQVTATRSRS